MAARKIFKRIRGMVWCVKNGTIHENSLDPYRYGPPLRRGDNDPRCKRSDHFPVFAEISAPATRTAQPKRFGWRKPQ